MAVGLGIGYGAAELFDVSFALGILARVRDYPLDSVLVKYSRVRRTAELSGATQCDDVRHAGLAFFPGYSPFTESIALVNTRAQRVRHA